MLTSVSDTVPAQAVGSVIGLGGMAGSIAATAYGLALAVIHLRLPSMEPMIFKPSKTKSI